MKEQVIVSLTTWSKRIANLPVVLDSIYAQTYQPDKVVLNLAFDEAIPEEVEVYLTNHDVEVNFVEDTKVYKKIIPTLYKYPDACVINIDDDFIYPNGMIEDFMAIHQQYPNFPISGNRVMCYGLICHCGCASLTKYQYFGDFLSKINDELIANCPSSDMVYTYIATLNGHPYIRTTHEYFVNMNSYNEHSPFSNEDDGIVKKLEKTYSYLSMHLGIITTSNIIHSLINDSYIQNLMDQYINYMESSISNDVTEKVEMRMRNTPSFRLGQILLRPLKFFKFRRQ